MGTQIIRFSGPRILRSTRLHKYTAALSILSIALHGCTISFRCAPSMLSSSHLTRHGLRSPTTKSHLQNPKLTAHPHCITATFMPPDQIISSPNSCSFLTRPSSKSTVYQVSLGIFYSSDCGPLPSLMGANSMHHCPKPETA